MHYLLTGLILQHSGFLCDAKYSSSLLLFPHRWHRSHSILIHLSGRSSLSLFLLLLDHLQRDSLLRFLCLYGLFYLLRLYIANHRLLLCDNRIIFSYAIVVLHTLTLQVTQNILNPKLAVFLTIRLEVDLLIFYLKIVLVVAAVNGSNDLARCDIVVIDLQVLMDRQSI